MFDALSVPVMALSVVMPSLVGIAQADPVSKTVYIDVEKNVLHRDLLLEPVAVTRNATETILDATKQAYGDHNGNSIDDDVDATTGQYAYIKAFADTNTTFAYNYTSDVSTAANGVVYRTDLPYQPIVDDSDYLRETEYNGISGWMFTVNNATTYIDANNDVQYYMASTPLSVLPDNAVIRWEFSEVFGADLGMNGVYVPTQVTAAGYYDWYYNTASFAARFDRADKTTLIRKMALNKTDPDYADALDALNKLIIDQSDVDDAAALLP